MLQNCFSYLSLPIGKYSFHFLINFYLKNTRKEYVNISTNRIIFPLALSLNKKCAMFHTHTNPHQYCASNLPAQKVQFIFLQAIYLHKKCNLHSYQQFTCSKVQFTFLPSIYLLKKCNLHSYQQFTCSKVQFTFLPAIYLLKKCNLHSYQQLTTVAVVSPFASVAPVTFPVQFVPQI